jgi:SAM-dependent methyltransferase
VVLVLAGMAVRRTDRMCNRSNIEFAKSHLGRNDVAGRTVLDVGSRNVNGSLREVIVSLGPLSYVGVDIEPGAGVDELCSVHDLIGRFGRESVDLVVSTELIEHVLDWRSALSQVKNVLKEGGVLLITTRSRGFPYHDYPADYWRYEIEDMEELFSDMQVEALEPDPLEAGVLMKARKPVAFVEKKFSEHRLYSMVRETRCRKVNALDRLLFRLRRSLFRRVGESASYRFRKLFGR